MSQAYERQLEEEVRQRTAEVRRREEEMVLRLISAAEYRDDETGAHIRRVELFSEVLASGPSAWIESRPTASGSPHRCMISAR